MTVLVWRKQYKKRKWIQVNQIPINPKLLKMIDSTLIKIKTDIFVKHKLQRK